MNRHQDIYAYRRAEYFSYMYAYCSRQFHAPLIGQAV